VSDRSVVVEYMIDFAQSFVSRCSVDHEGGMTQLEVYRGNEVISSVTSATFSLGGTLLDEAIYYLVSNARADWSRCGSGSPRSYVLYLLESNTKYRLVYRFLFSADGMIVSGESGPDTVVNGDRSGGVSNRRLPRKATHYLKSWPQCFQEVVDGKKSFEVREDDRGFAVGDIVVLCEYDPERCASIDVSEARARALGYTGREVRGMIVNILRPSDIGWAKGKTVLGLNFVVLGMRWDERTKS